MNLPFLGVTNAGPVHLDVKLTPASIAKLLTPAERTPAPAPAAVASTPQPQLPSPEPPKKRGWWPFGG